MKLIGKKITRISKEDLNSKAELTVDPIKGNMKISGYALRKLDLEDKYLGFAYDDETPDTPGKVYIYIVEDDDGIKVGKTGILNSRWHSRELRDRFNEGSVEKFKLNIVVLAHSDSSYEGISFHEVKWNDSKDVIITKTETEIEHSELKPVESIEEAADPEVPKQEEVWVNEDDQIDF